MVMVRIQTLIDTPRERDSKQFTGYSWKISRERFAVSNTPPSMLLPIQQPKVARRWHEVLP